MHQATELCNSTSLPTIREPCGPFSRTSPRSLVMYLNDLKSVRSAIKPLRILPKSRCHSVCSRSVVGQYSTETTAAVKSVTMEKDRPVKIRVNRLDCAKQIQAIATKNEAIPQRNKALGRLNAIAIKGNPAIIVDLLYK